MISREVSVCNLKRNSESYSSLQPGLNGNPFFLRWPLLWQKRLGVEDG